ncbi:hypothetical protein JCM3774_002191 [Rhodotorula dairenensis]
MANLGPGALPGGVTTATDADSPPSAIAGARAPDLPSSGESTASVRMDPDGYEEHGTDEPDEVGGETDGAAFSDGRSRSLDEEASVAGPSGSDKGSASTQTMPAQAKSQASFVHKVWAMLEDPTLSDYIAWSEDGKSFLVFNPSDFARDVLPRFFKHSNFSSFLRQCNFYNWSKVNDALSSTNSVTHADGSQGHAWEFRNPSFQRGRPDLLGKIKRKTAKAAPTPTQVPSRRRASFALVPSARNPRNVPSVDRDAADSGDDTQQEAEVDDGSSRPRSHGNPHEPFAPSASDGAYRFVSAPTQGTSDRVWNEVRNGRPENALGPISPTLPPTRQEPPPPQPAPPHFYSQAGPSRYSPANRPYPLPTTDSNATHRRSLPEDPVLRQLETLEAQVRALGEVLHQEQVEHASTRATSYAVLQSLIEALSGLDREGRFHQELQAAHRILSRFETGSAPTAYSGTFASHLGSALSNWSGNGLNPAGPFSSRPSTATQFYYNRVPAVESYTRTARPDSRTAIVSHGDLRPASSGSQLEGLAGRRSPPGFGLVRHGEVTVDAPPDPVGSLPGRKPYTVSAYPHSGCLAPMTAAPPTFPPIKHELSERVDVPSNNRSLPPLSSLLNPVDPAHRWPDSATRDQLPPGGDGGEPQSLKRPRY